MCSSHCLWMKAGSLTFHIYNCYSQQCQRDGFIQTQQPHFWLLDICYLPSTASDEKDHEVTDRNIIKEQSRARSAEVACRGSTPALSLTGHRTLDKSLHYTGTYYIVGWFWEFSELQECIIHKALETMSYRVNTIWVFDIMFYVLYEWQFLRELMKVTSNFLSGFRLIVALLLAYILEEEREFSVACLSTKIMLATAAL